MSARSLVLVLGAAAVLFIGACGGSAGGGEKEFTAGPDAQRYELKGRVVSVDKQKRVASIEHEKIEGFMEAMTMDFEFREQWVWDVLSPGSEVQAELVVDNAQGRYWLEKPRIIEAPADRETTAPRDDVASVGKKVIDFSLTDQDGRKLSPKDFEGKAWAITFIYTECPLPEYCVLMSKNFSDLANRLADDEDLGEKIRLLSISFDPAKDTPDKLKSYGLGYLGRNTKAGDFRIWKLAVGEDRKVREIADFFGLRYEVDEKDKTQFNHSLRTIVIGSDGKVVKVFSGNDWNPDDLLSALRSAL